jgi:hypothetical protein
MTKNLMNVANTWSFGTNNLTEKEIASTNPEETATTNKALQKYMVRTASRAHNEQQHYMTECKDSQHTPDVGCTLGLTPQSIVDDVMVRAIVPASELISTHDGTKQTTQDYGGC